VIRVTIDRSSRLRISENASVVHERLWSLVGVTMQLDENALYIQKVAFERVEVSFGLQVLRRSAAVSNRGMTN
jgi:hypothetical protein